MSDVSRIKEQLRRALETTPALRPLFVKLARRLERNSELKGRMKLGNRLPADVLNSLRRLLPGSAVDVRPNYDVILRLDKIAPDQTDEKLWIDAICTAVGVADDELAGQTLTVAAMVGFISLGGIASRNGILLLNHYLHLVRHEGETWSKEMIIRAGKERLAPVLMTALTSGIGLVPLAMAAGEPGKEILYPVATVIVGGLISSTVLEFFVRPALFWTFGRGAGERLIETAFTEVDLIEEKEEVRHADDPASMADGRELRVEG